LEISKSSVREGMMLVKFLHSVGRNKSTLKHTAIILLACFVQRSCGVLLGIVMPLERENFLN
jgi:hypothetical protein